MPLFDLPLPELQHYRPEVAEPPDFDAFWQATLARARRHEVLISVEPVATGLRHVEVLDVTFAGFDGHPIKAWYSRPAGATEPLPTIVTFLGYSGGRGAPFARTLVPSAGYAELLVDSRGQGWNAGSPGETPDPVGSAPASPGVMTRGIQSPESSYFRRLFTDAARGVDAARALPGADPRSVVVSGASQGGGMAIAAAGLVPDVAGLMTDVPFLQHIRRAVEITASTPYVEITAHLAAHRGAARDAWRTLSYIDGVNHAARGRAPSLWSVALMDDTCPPSTVYASFNAYNGAKEIEVYGYNGHEGGGQTHVGRQLRWLAGLLG